MASNEQIMIATVEDVAKETLKNKLNDKYNDLKKISRNFLKKTGYLEASIEQQEKKITASKILKDYSSIQSEFAAAKKNKDIETKEAKREQLKGYLTKYKELLMQFYKDIFEYQDNIQDILGYTMETTFVFSGLQGEKSTQVYKMQPDFFKENLDELVNLTMGSSGKLQASFKSQDALLNFLIEKGLNDINSKNDNIKVEQQRLLLNQVYEEVIRRFDISRTHIKKSSIGYILYKTDFSKEKWSKNKIASKGFINEIFSSELDKILNNNEMSYEYKSMTSEQNIEENVGHFTSLVLETGNMSGLLMGDAQYKKQNNVIQNAVKSAGAQLMGYKQVVDFAEAINKSNHYSDIEKDIDKLLKNSKVNKEVSRMYHKTQKAIIEEIKNNFD